MVTIEKYVINFYRNPIQFFEALINHALLHSIQKHEKLTIF